MKDLFLDIDADGALDYLRYRNQLGPANLMFSRGAQEDRYRPRDVIERITNGYGAVTQIRYQPLSNKAVYRRDYGSILDADRNAVNGPTRFGRGSPVIDVMSPMYLVASVSSSSPVRNNSGAVTEVHYRYAGAKLQTGGRGFLGFRELVTLDGNGDDSTGYVIGSSEYRQDYPFIGSPERTSKWVVTGPLVLDPCHFNMEASGQNCFAGYGTSFPAIVAPLAQASVSVYESAPVFDPMMSPQSLHVRWQGSDEYTADFNQGGVLTSRVISAATYDSDGSGDVLITGSETREAPFERAPLATANNLSDWIVDARQQVLALRGLTSCTAPCIRLEVTENTYFPKDFVNWRLGRIQTTSVTIRNGAGQVRDRLSDFTYDLNSSAKTGLLTSERVQKAVDFRQDLRTLYQLDVFGNRIAAFTCSNDLVDAACLDRFQVVMRPINGNGSPSERVHRYARTQMDSVGRFVTATYAPFFNGGSGNGVAELPTMQILSRDEHGQVTLQLDTNGRAGGATTGWLGRTLQTWTQTGDVPTQYAETITRLRWCVGTPQPGSKVACPSGAVFRAKSVVSGSAATYSYFDILGRETLKVTESFNQGVSGKDFHASCVGFDLHSRIPFASEPFFLTSTAVNGEPDFLSGTYSPCAAVGLTGTHTTFDPVGRVARLQTPEHGPSNPAEVVTNYIGLTTVATTSYLRDTNGDGIDEFRQQVTSEVKNASGELVLAIDASQRATKFQYNADGQLAFVCSNAIEAQSSSTICPSGSANQIVSSFQYDALGRKVSENNSDLGVIAYVYNAANEVIQTTDAKGNRVQVHYDAQGRVWRRVSTPTAQAVCSNGVLFCDGFEGAQLNPANAVVDNFTFDTDLNGIGLVAESDRLEPGFPVQRKTFDYDSIGRPTAIHTLLDGQTYSEGTTYDLLGRPETQTDVTGSFLTQHYTPRGFVEAVTYSLGGAELSRTLETNARGQVVQERRGGQVNMGVARQFDPMSGRLVRVCTGFSCSIQESDFAWDSLGTLIAREHFQSANPAKNHREIFLYDDLHRLTQSRLTRVAGVVPGGGFVTAFTATYDALGNICAKNGNAYRYGPRSGCANSMATGSPHAVQQAYGKTLTYDANGDIEFSDGLASDRRITYDAQRQALDIDVVGTSPHRTQFRYGPDGSRYKRTDINSIGSTVTRYLGNVEIINLPSGVVEIKRYLSGVAVFTTRNNAPGSLEQRYLFGDHLGSIDTITDQFGTTIESLSFDPHGGRRDAVDWQGPGSPASTTTRGFTGHEHLDGVGLIHMNARLFDAELGRFLQADLIVEAPTSLQSWNRYTYVFNNPLSLTDPTGRFSSRDVQGFIGFVATLMTGGIASTATGLSAYGVVAAGGFVATTLTTSNWRSGLWGALSAFAFHGIGETFSNGTLNGSGIGKITWKTAPALQAAKTLAHGMVGGAFHAIQGGKLGHGFLSAAVTQGLSEYVDRIDSANPGFSAARTAAAALVGGTVSDITGGKFINGAMTAAFSRAFNDEREIARFKAKFRQASQMVDSYRDGVSMFRFATEDAAVNHFADFAVGITVATGIEVGANLMRDMFGYFVSDLTVTPFFSNSPNSGGVNTTEPIMTSGVAYVGNLHTHPNNDGMFSGDETYWNKKTGVVGGYGDIGTYINQRVPGYMAQPNGAIYRFDTSGFLAATRAPAAWTVYARDYVSQVR